jgi:hypothetical protein
MQVGEVVAVHRQNIIEADDVSRYHQARAQAGDVMAAERSRLYGAQGWSLADVSIERSSRIDREGGGEAYTTCHAAEDALGHR